MQEDLSEKIVFHDKENALSSIIINIKEGKLSISGDCGRSSGQCQDNIKPANAEQKRVLEIWNTWHLNDMKAGTPRQEEALKEFKGKYTDQVKFLKKKRLYSDNGYKYGSKWLKRELPAELSEELEALCQKIREQEQQRKESLKEGDFSEETSSRVKALASSLGLTPREAEQDITEESETDFDYCGITYFVGTEEESTERAKDYIDKEQWIEAIKADTTTDGFEEWQEYVIEMDGFGQILNHHDGSEDTQDIDGTTYYIIRM